MSRTISLFPSLPFKAYLQLRPSLRLAFCIRPYTAELKWIIITYNWIVGIRFVSRTTVSDREAGSAEQDQTTRMCRLILLSTLRKLNYEIIFERICYPGRSILIFSHQFSGYLVWRNKKQTCVSVNSSVIHLFVSLF